MILDTLGMIAFYDREINCVKLHSSVHNISQYNGFSQSDKLSNEKEIALKASEVYMKYGRRILYVTYERTNASIEWENRYLTCKLS